jgi:hypothetical protein
MTDDLPESIPAGMRADILAARAEARQAVAEHLLAGRSVYFGDRKGRVFERTSGAAIRMLVGPGNSVVPEVGAIADVEAVTELSRRGV